MNDQPTPQLQDTPLIFTIHDDSSSLTGALFESGDSFRRILEGAIEPLGLPEADLSPKTDPQIKLEWWIEGRQGDGWEALDTGADHWKAAGSRSGANCFYVGSSCQAIFFFRAVKAPIPEPEVKGHLFAVGLLPGQHDWEEVSRSRSAAGKP
jgi:hypothetical protein